MMKRLVILGFFAAFGLAHDARAEGAPVLAVDVDHGVPLTLAAPAASVFVANPDIADVQVMSPTSIMIFGKRTGETTFMATDNAGRTLAQRTIDVTQDLGDLRRELALAIPDAKIQAQAAPNGIVLTGTAKDAATIADAYKLAQRYLPSGGDIINRVRVMGSNQIMIRVRFAEIQRSIDSELGINWQNLISTGGFVFGLATGAPIVSSTNPGTAFDINQVGGIFPRPNNTDLSVPNDVLGGAYTGSHFNINAMIDALAQDGFVTILAEPNLTAMSGETANFLAGGEFPIPVPQGNGAISIEFKNYGIGLEFTPTIIGDNRINLHVKPEVSELTTTGQVTIDQIAVPGLLTRKAETTVEVASGQSFAIAGLLDNSQAQTVNKFPLLGDMPILGPLFRDSRFQNGQTELVIIVTPYIVTPSGEQLALPTDGLSPPSEWDRLVKMRYSSSDPNTRPQSGQAVGMKIEPPEASAMIPPVPDDAAVPAVPASAISVPASTTVSPVINVPAQAKPTSLAPAGPSGFSLE